MAHLADKWRPTYSRETAIQRSKVLNQIRRYFEQTEALAVETPALSQFGATDVQLTQWQTREGFQLHTSPEYGMKRLLAAGFGDIYQICPVYRQDEVGQRHNPEFSMLEWYRVGFDEHQLMNDVVKLIQFLRPDELIGRELISYQQAFMACALPDPHKASLEELQQVASIKLNAKTQSWLRDECLDALMALVVEPSLPKDTLCFIHDYPASQAALAETHFVDGNFVARRFELYWQGMELANGYFELTDASEQKLRFDQDINSRTDQASDLPAIDKHFLAALDSGMPVCAGVALGIDRLMMILLDKQSIEDVIAFPFDRA